MNSPQANLDLLAARVQKLEASNHRWKLLNALLVLSIASVVVMGAKPADRLQPNVVRAGSVEAQEFILKDETGHVYARLSLNLNPALPKVIQKGRAYFIPSDSLAIPGQPALQFFDDKGDVVWTVPQAPTLRPVN
jgi:hypothetical protein